MEFNDELLSASARAIRIWDAVVWLPPREPLTDPLSKGSTQQSSDSGFIQPCDFRNSLLWQEQYVFWLRSRPPLHSIETPSSDPRTTVAHPIRVKSSLRRKPQEDSPDAGHQQAAQKAALRYLPVIQRHLHRASRTSIRRLNQLDPLLQPRAERRGAPRAVTPVPTPTTRARRQRSMHVPLHPMG